MRAVLLCTDDKIASVLIIWTHQFNLVSSNSVLKKWLKANIVRPQDEEKMT